MIICRFSLVMVMEGFCLNRGNVFARDPKFWGSKTTRVVPSGIYIYDALLLIAFGGLG